MWQAIIGAVAAVMIVFLGINWAEGNFCWSDMCQKAWQAKLDARPARSTWTDVTPPSPDDGLRDARHVTRERPAVIHREVPPPQGQPRVRPYVVREFDGGQAYCDKYMPGATFRGWVGSGAGRMANCLF